jgi:ornithine cyclodeaminase/alanine dehydrogenase-like protein (mu-crystallin family)
MMGYARELSEIRVYSPNPAHREAYAAEMQEELKIPVTVVEHQERLMEGCDMIAACTTANFPVITREGIRPGQFLCSVTNIEVARDAADVIDAVVLHQTVESSTLLTYATGEGRIDPSGFIDPVSQPPNSTYATGPRVRGTLAQLVNGRIKGRESEAETSFFYNNIGSGIQFAAIAGAAYEVIRGTPGLREIPTDWLTQTIRD